MKRIHLATVIPFSLLFCALIYFQAEAEGKGAGGGFRTWEFATLRWDGKHNTSLIRSNGRVEELRPLLEKYSLPRGTDARAFYMTIAANAAGREGFEVASMTPDMIVLKRPVE